MKRINNDFLFYIVRKGKQLIYVLGANHSHYPQDPQFKEIKKHWRNFLGAVSSKKALVLVEGGESERTAITACFLPNSSGSLFTDYVIIQLTS